ncbi:hypothetical protein Tco_1101635 [Tanacetum coccineum]
MWAVEGMKLKILPWIINKGELSLRFGGIFVDGFWEETDTRTNLDGPFILDGKSPLVVKEQRTKRRVFKVGFAKAYVSASIMINGSPSKEVFFAIVVIKQGDPLAPLSLYLNHGIFHLSFQPETLGATNSLSRRYGRENTLLFKAWLDNVIHSGSIVGSERVPFSLSNFLALFALDLNKEPQVGCDGNFRVKEIRNYIDDLFLPHQAASTRWIKYIPIKVNVFAWRAPAKYCLTDSSYLIRRGITIEVSLCPVGFSLRGVVCHISSVVIGLSLFFVAYADGGLRSSLTGFIVQEWQS